MIPMNAEKGIGAPADGSFSREELEGILRGLVQNGAWKSPTPQPSEVLFRGLSMEELEAITRFFLS